MFNRKDDGACRYYGTLYGVFAVLKEKGLVDASDMNAMVSYADLATQNIQRVVESIRIINPPLSSYDDLFPKSMKEKEEALAMMLEAIETLESMAGPTAIVDKIRSEVESRINTEKQRAKQERRARMKVIDGGNDGSDKSGTGDHSD